MVVHVHWRTGIVTEIDETDKLLVASSAIIPIFRFPSWRYRNLNEVLIYPGAFNEEYETAGGEERNILGIVGEGSMQRMMILSRPSLRQGFADDGSKQNVGIHEFVHLLDKADGTTDGIPELFLTKPYIIPWIKVMHEEIQAMQTGNSDINIYGSKNEAEFLSVVSEYFFNQPELLKERHPELYELLERVFRPGLDDGS
ncbi:MAG: M90 family metallopeptidase [Saprospiraceae bacterium]